MTDVRTFDGAGPVAVAVADEGDLPGIVDLLNDVAANSIATFDTRRISVDERRAWFRQFSSTGPYRLLVARRGDQVVGYACCQRPSACRRWWPDQGLHPGEVDYFLVRRPPVLVRACFMRKDS
ncbi:GNAT family N-acetyltransferase, partial [Acrocarpospora catenulata]|uniref:GNAT family N-acetyltransferase n=1 Tax=Acrocarpospora catenulata TaxID=2836182 RepID=UPI001BD91B3D